MPISMAPTGVELTIARITGTDKLKTHLNNLGFIEGEPLTVVSRINENVIVKLKGVSMAITHDLAKRIFV